MLVAGRVEKKAVSLVVKMASRGGSWKEQLQAEMMVDAMVGEMVDSMVAWTAVKWGEILVG